MSEPTTERSGVGKFTTELLLAALAFVGCDLWLNHLTIPAGRTDWLCQQVLPPARSIRGLWDPVYQVLPALFTDVRMLAQGIFPSWSPFSQAGTPLLAKMQHGVFALPHLPLYILPLAWLPRALLLTFALQGLLAFVFTYLLARCLRVGFPGAILAGILFAFSMILRGGVLPQAGSSGLYLPMLLLVMELYFRGFPRLSQFLMPCAAALPFLAGHFESAFYGDLVASVYFTARLWTDKSLPAGGRLSRWMTFAGLMGAAALVAAVQLLPPVEYLRLSYNNVWRNRAWFPMLWDFDTIGKRLSMDDAGMLSLGLAALLGFVWTLKGCLRKDHGSPFGAGAPRNAAAALLLAVALAALTALGFDASLSYVAFPLTTWTPTLLSPIAGWLLVFLSFWESSRTDEPGLAILGWVLLGSLLIAFKTPPLANLLLHTPMFENFHNAAAPHWEAQLSVAVLGAAALERCRRELSRPWGERVGAALRAFSISSILVAGYLVSLPLRGVLAGAIPAGVTSQGQAARTRGGIMGPDVETTFGRRHAVTLWTPSFPPPAHVAVGFAQGNKMASGVDVTSSASCSGARCYYHGSFELPAVSDTVTALAVVRYADGTQQVFPGTRVTVRRRGPWDASSWILLGCVLLFPLVLLLPAAPLGLLAAALLILAVRDPIVPMPAEHMPYPLPGVRKIQEDRSVFRIFSLNYNFLQADYPSMYGLEDLRTGGDNLDALSMVYFNHLCGHYLQDPKDQAAFDTGLKLLGLGNVKYLLDTPEAGVPHPGLDAAYKGEDMSVFQNKRWSPRATFYESFEVMPLGDWLDWSRQGQILGSIVRLLASGTLPIEKTLLLHDKPSSGALASGQPAPAGGGAAVSIEEYSPGRIRLTVDAARPGFVFLGNTHFPGWKASVNGQETPILRSWIAFQAVEVPAGKSTLVFSYRPVPLRVGGALSFLSLLAWGLLYLRHHPLRRPPSPPDSPAAAPPARKKKKAAPAAPAAAGVPDGLAVDCAAAAEWIIVSCVGAGALFWACWSAFAYRGDEPFVRPAAWVALGALLVGGALRFGRSRSAGAAGPASSAAPGAQKL